MTAKSSTPPPDRKCGTVAGRLRINAATEIQVLSEEYNGRCYLHIRQYFLADDNQFRPTSKGVSLAVERITEVLEGVSALREQGDHPGVASVVPKGAKEEIRFSVVEWEGTKKADIRIYYTKEGKPDLQAGKGVRLNLALLPELERALEALDRALD